MKPHIIYLHQYFVFPDAAGGTRSYDLATNFVKNGCKVTVVTTSAFMKNKEQFTDTWTVIARDGLEVHVLKADYDNKFSFAQRLSAFWKFLYRSSTRIARIKGDVLLATSTPLTIALPALYNRMFKKTPFVFEVRDVWPEAPVAIGVLKNKIAIDLLYRLERKAYRHAAAIVALSTDMKRSISSRYRRLTEGKLYVIENISELERFRTASSEPVVREKGKKTLLYAGTFGNVNGLAYVLKLAAGLRKRGYEGIAFHLYGDGKEKDALIEEARTAEVLDSLVFVHAPVSKSELATLYRDSTWGSSFVINIPQLWANSANKFFDTLAAGRPVIINHEGWQAEVIRKENIGYVLPADLGSWTEDDWNAFIRYAEDDELLNQQGRNALSIAARHYSLDSAVDRYLDIFKHHIHVSK